MQARIIGDLGGTRLRLGLVVDSAVLFSQDTPCADWPTLPDALRAFLALPEVAPHAEGAELVLGVATDIGLGGQVWFPGRDWRFSPQTLAHAVGFPRVAIINDFEALALSVPHFSPSDLEVLQPGHAHGNAPCLVMGAGTGFGMSGLVPLGAGKWHAVAAEGGHASLCADTPEHQEILAILQKKHGRIKIERVFSGPGLVNLAQAVGVLREEPHVPGTPEDILSGYLAGNPFCRDVLRIFAGWLGRMCGDMALAWGARGGIFFAGGLLQGLGASWFLDNDFLQNFCAKGRYASYLEDIPVHLVTRPLAAFPGLVHYCFEES